MRLDRLSREDSERLVEDLRRVIGIFDPDHVDAACVRIRSMLTKAS